MNETIKTLLYKTIHRNKKSIEQIADEIGITSNSLYRYCLDGESGSDLPLKRLVPLMIATKNFSILDHIARICGFVLIKVPRFANKREESIDILDNYQESTGQAQRSLKEFFRNPDQTHYDKAKEALLEVMKQSASADKYIDKSFTGQMELEL